MASIFLNEQQYSEADANAQKAYHFRKENPSECTSTLDLLGSIALAQGDVQKAEDLFLQALKLRRKAFQSENDSHPDIGQSHEYLAILYVKQKRHLDAIDHYRLALTIYENNYPPTNSQICKIVQRLKSLEKLV